MATRGRAKVWGVGKGSSWIILPDNSAFDVLFQACRRGEQIEIRLIAPTRGKKRKARDHTLRLRRDE